MNEIYLELAGLNTLLQTPWEITISESLRPFVCQKHEKVDCTILLQICDRLPDFSENGVWHGLEYYDSQEGVLRVFHCKAFQEEAFAVTQLFENGDVEILVLPDYCSYFTGTEGIFNRIGMETLLLQHKGLLLHASLIKYKEKTIAFAGPSGVGKSTQANIWKKNMGSQILNGDRSMIRLTEAGWSAFGSPYAGTSGIYKNDHAPLAAIIVLEQGEENSLRELSMKEALRYLYPEFSIHSWDKAFVEKVTDLCLQLLAQIPVYHLKCLPHKSAALLVKKGLGL